MYSLAIEDLGKCYRPVRKRSQREIWALRHVSAEVEPGTILGIIGPNGAGKTTLLKILARVTTPTEGRVIGRGRVIPLLALGAGFQADLSGRENVFLNAAMYGIRGSEVEKRFDRIVEFAGIGDLIEMPVKRYSSGMYLRLAFSVAINMDPDILLADEVLAVGDAEFQEQCLRRVQEAGRAGITVLFVSHDMSAITRLCHRVLWLNSGEVVDCGDPGAIAAKYQNAAWTRVRKARPPRDGSRAGQQGEILFVRLVSAEGQELGAVRVSEEAYILIAFSVAERGVRVRCAIDVYARGTHAFRSVQPEEPTLDAPGAYRARVQIPPHLLSETIYTVNASVTLTTAAGVHSLVEYHALSFQVFDIDERRSARGTYREALPGAVSPRLVWDLVKARDVVTA